MNVNNQSRQAWLVTISLALALCAAAPARADILHLMNGGRVEGEATRQDGGWEVKTRTGTVFIRDDQLRYYEKRLSPEEEYKQKLETLAEDDFDAQVAMGDWCKQRGLRERATYHYNMAVGLNPEDRRARRAAGYVRHEGEWLLHEEAMKRRGLVEYLGKWIPAQEAEEKRLQVEHEAKTEEALQTIWSVLKNNSAASGEAGLERAVEKILCVDPLYRMPPLERASNMPSPRARRIVLMALGRMEDMPSLNLMLYRLMIERHPALVDVIYAQLVNRTDSETVLTRALDIALNHTMEAVRNRMWVVIERLGDTRVIDALIPLAGRKVDPVKITERQDPVQVDGREAQVGRPKNQEPYYPAHEGLLYLTGELFGPDPEQWNTWWEHARETFVFRTTSGSLRVDLDDLPEEEETKLPDDTGTSEPPTPESSSTTK